MNELFLTIWTAIYSVVMLAYFWELVSRDTPKISCPQWVRTFVAEAWYAIPFVILADLAIVTWGAAVPDRTLAYVLKILLLAGWLLTRPPDDRWRRRRLRLTARVRRRGSRLIVSPKGTP